MSNDGGAAATSATARGLASQPRPELLVSGAPVAHLPAVERFETFYLRELPGLVALARALTRSPGSAEDIAQEAMIAAYRRWAEVSTLDMPAFWVRRVCANLASSHIRRRSIEARAMLRLGTRPAPPTELPPTDEAFWTAVRDLPRRQAQVVALHYVFDMSVLDIAHSLACSPNTVKTHLVRGRAALSVTFNVEPEDLP